MHTLRIYGPGESSMAWSVAHELNNIAASMFGFVELATAGAAEGSAPHGPLAELRIGVRRIMRVSGILEQLAETQGSPARVAIADCIPEPGSTGANEAFRIEWSTDRADAVVADAARIRAAVRVLAELAAADREDRDAPSFTIGRPGGAGSASDARCRVCAQPVPSEALRVAILDDAVRAVFRERKGRLTGATLAALAIGACGHLTHLGGAHLTFDDADGALSIALARAPGEAEQTYSGAGRAHGARTPRRTAD